MILSDVSVRRPVAMGSLLIGLALLGLNAYRKMGLELLPQMDMPYITIVTIYPGASPEDIEIDVARRIEDAVTAIDGLKHVSSSCMENVSQTLLEFELGVDVDIASTDVREKIDLILQDLPDGVESPQILKFDVNAQPIITMALTGDAPIDELFDYADNRLKDRITTIAGVAEVRLVGGATREAHVLLDRERLAARGLTALDVSRAIQSNICAIPSGRLREGPMEYSVKFDADFQEVDAIADLEIAGVDGQRLRIRDVGRVEMTTAEMRQMAAIDGRPCISIQIVKKADANAVAVTREVRRAMDDINPLLPGGMALIWVNDLGGFIEATVNSAWSDVGIGIVLTAAILFIFLYNLRALLVVAITMPLTIVIGLFFMFMVGFTLNAATLIAIGMSVGILVTNSIVVLEAIVSNLEETGDPKEAARLGAKETFIAVLASAGTNMVVLFPLSMLDSAIGQFIGPLALTMFIMTVVSLFISFTLTPLLCSLLLKPKSKQKHLFLDRVEAVWNRGLDRIIAGYRWVLLLAERYRLVAGLIVLAVAIWMVQSLTLAAHIGGGLVVDSDRGEAIVKIEFPTWYSLNYTTERTRELEERLADLPELRHRLTNIGKVEGVIGQSSEGVYLAQILLKFSERTERDLTFDDLMGHIRDRLTEFPEAIISVNEASAIGGSSMELEMEIAGESLETLDQLALRVQEMALAMPGITDTDTSVRDGKPEIRIYPNRSVLADLHMPAVELGTTLRANLEGLESGSFKRDARNYDIVVKLEETMGREQIQQFQFAGAPGQPISLDTLATVVETQTPIQIIRKNKQRVAKFFANTDRSLAMGTAVDRLNTLIAEEGDFPPGYTHTFVGAYEVMQEGQDSLLEAMVVAVVLVVLTLSAILESFRQPVLILVTLPLALIGVLWALYLTGATLDIFVIMGIVMMVGIVVNNAILIMDQFNVHVAEGASRHGAMIGAACERFRPILMITLAAVLGMLPLALGRGIGAEMRNGIGIAAVGGILVSGVLTLLVLPILYDLFTRRPKHAKVLEEELEHGVE